MYDYVKQSHELWINKRSSRLAHVLLKILLLIVQCVHNLLCLYNISAIGGTNNSNLLKVDDKHCFQRRTIKLKMIIMFSSRVCLHQFIYLTFKFRMFFYNIIRYSGVISKLRSENDIGPEFSILSAA